MKQNAEQSLNPLSVTDETLIRVNAARQSFGLAPYSEQYPSGSFSWPDEARQILYGVETGLSQGILGDFPGFKTLAAKSPAVMAVTLVKALQDGFLSLKSVTQFEQAWHRLDLLERTLRCTADSLAMTRAQAEGEDEERFLRCLTHRINFAEKTFKHLREVIK